MAKVEMEKLLTVEELSAWIKLPESTIHQYVAQDRIPSYKIGRVRRFEPEEIRVWLSKQSGNTMTKSRKATRAS